MNIIDGKKTAQEIKDEIKQEVAALNQNGVFPKLAVVLVGDDPASAVYVRDKKRACEYTGILSEAHELPGSIAEAELLELIARLNADTAISGILVQSPLPGHIDADKVFAAVAPGKDVDCFNPENVGLLTMGKPRFLPCTPGGVIELLARYQIGIKGKNCVVIGRSNIVGKPMAALLLANDGTVTVCHSKTAALADVSRGADILIAAMRQPKFITADMVKEGAVVIDVGIHVTSAEGGVRKLCGDVDFDSAASKCAYITPVPGGVGPMTIAMLMRNCVSAAKAQNNR